MTILRVGKAKQAAALRKYADPGALDRLVLGGSY